jgi:cytochrome P450
MVHNLMPDSVPGKDEAVSTTDWTTKFDHFSPEYAANPFAVWEYLREECPIARSEKFRGMWVPTRLSDIEEIARDTSTFSSRSPLVTEFASMADFEFAVPPISSDPPYHTEFRRLLLPFFAPARIEAWRTKIEELADALIDSFIDRGSCDAAKEYAQHIPVQVIAEMLGVPSTDSDRFRHWVHQLLEVAPTDFELAIRVLLEFHAYLFEQVSLRRDEPGDDLISFLLNAEIEGRPLEEREIFGGCLLLLMAGIDTTWSAIGAAIWHLAQNQENQQQLRDDDSLWPSAIEEILRAFAPVTMAREVTRDTEFHGCPMKAGDPLLLPFPSANRDPRAFDDADKVTLDRPDNRHLAFGVGIHRCLGSNLARLELTVATQRFLARIPTFRLADPDAVTWSPGQVRGPRVLPITF